MARTALESRLSRLEAARPVVQMSNLKAVYVWS
jgi:hypothetical protein